MSTPIFRVNDSSITYRKGIYVYIKKIFDFISSIIGLIIFFPIGIVIAILIKIEDPKGPIFFYQRRIGLNGKPFLMFKFRTMVKDAEILKVQMQNLNESSGPMFKIKNDPRVTKIGKFLRKTSIDEIPQLLNVILGDMSLIGPRPSLPIEVEKYDNFELQRLYVKPGCSGLWQISGRSDLSFEEMVNLDLFYVENMSFILDIKIILKTFIVMIVAKGAY